MIDDTIRSYASLLDESNYWVDYLVMVLVNNAGVNINSINFI